jgi:predicted DNA-binding transcriptional regulator AlpA
MNRPNGSGSIATRRPGTPGPETQSAAPAAARLDLVVADEILDLKSAARLLGYSRSHLSKILAGKFPDLPKLRHVRVGRTVRMRRGAVLEWFYQAENGNRNSGPL